MTFAGNMLKKFFSRDWFLSGLLVGLFLLTNRYIYGWDDQHLEIPLLKRLIDPSLYPGDYYVDGLQANFISYLYPLLSRVISVDSIPAVYLFLYVVVRYFFFFWIFRLWLFISGKDRAAAFFCTLTVFLIGRTEELIYRTFSHQEFALPIIFAGIYYFYRERFFLAACIFGLAANIHALYALFPMVYLGAYLLLVNKDRKWLRLVQSCLGFVLCALPLLLWMFQRVLRTRLNADPALYNNWVELYILSCPQTFIFGDKPLAEVLANTRLLLEGLQSYIFAAVLFMVHWCVNPLFRKDRKVAVISFVALLLVGATYVFSYIVPSHFVLDLNLVRNEQYVRIFLSGYTVLLVWRSRFDPLWKVVLFCLLLAVSNGKEFSDILLAALTGGLILFSDAWRTARRSAWVMAFLFFVVAGGYLVLSCRYDLAPWIRAMELKFFNSPALQTDAALPWIKMIRWLAVLCGLSCLAFGVMLLRGNERWGARLRTGLFLVPFLVMFSSFCYNHYVYLRMTRQGGGFWQLQRNWEDMQKYVRGHTPKDALIMAPNDMEMGGFRIHSDRTLLTDYRDCGIVGFDIKAAVEWRRRMQDIDAFKVFVREPLSDALYNGIIKYKADYIVFMKYAAPPDSVFLQRIHENEVFVLYRVNKNG